MPLAAKVRVSWPDLFLKLKLPPMAELVAKHCELSYQNGVRWRLVTQGVPVNPKAVEDIAVAICAETGLNVDLTVVSSYNAFAECERLPAQTKAA